MSNERKTKNMKDSSNRNDMLYFFMSFSMLKFQDNSTQIGIKKPVNRTKSKLRPSRPRASSKFEEGTHLRL